MLSRLFCASHREFVQNYCCKEVLICYSDSMSISEMQ